MTIDFTEQERQYIVKEPLNWHVSEDCPESMREDIVRKLNALYEWAADRARQR